MAIGPNIFKEQYEGYTLEQLNKKLEELKIYLTSDELKQFRQEEIARGVDDNNCIANVETEIEVIEDLIREKELILPKENNTEKMFIRKYKTDGTEEETQVELPKIEIPFTTDDSKYYEKISKLLDISLLECKKFSKRIPEENATYYYNPVRGGKSVIVSDDGSYLGATSSVNFDKHLEEFKNGRRNGNFNDQEKNNTNQNLSVLNSIITKIISSHQEFSAKPPVYDVPNKFFLAKKDNQQYLVSILDKHLMTYTNNLDSNEKDDVNLLVYNLSNNKSEILSYENFSQKYSLEIEDINIQEILKNKSNLEVEEIIKIKRSLTNILECVLQNNELIDLEKYKNEYLPKFLLSLTTSEVKIFTNSRIDENNNKILRIKCHSCGNEIKIDCSKLPTDVKTLDTMCPNCKSFIKYGNLNYVEKNDLVSIISISAIEKVQRIPTKFFENTILFVSKENAAINNKKVLIDEKKFNFITNMLEQKLSELREIKNKQTPEFLSSHISYDDTSKIFNIKLNNEEISINYHTGTESDKYINDLINLIIDILMKEDKKIENEINSAFQQDLKNINSMLKDVGNMIFGEKKNFKLAKEKLLDFVKGISIFENDNETDYYNFDDIIQFIIYTRLNKTNKKVIWSSIPFYTAYSYLAYIYNEEKNYDEALKTIAMQMKIAPLNLSSYFERCETYKMQNMWEEFKNETLNIYDKIYDARDLAHYYRNLGYYYTEMNNLDLAYALYTASTKFENNKNAYWEMTYIDQKLNRPKYNMTAEEGIKLLNDNNIAFGPKQENLNMLVEIYSTEKELVKNPSTEMLLAGKIYYLTKDKRFAPFFEKIDKTTGCSIVIPRSWNPIKPEVIKEKFSKNQMFAIYTDTNALFQAVYDGKCAEEEFNEAYNLNVSNIKNNKQFNTKLLKESIIDLKLQQGLKRFNQALFEIITNENKKIYLYHNFTLINGIFVDFSIDVDSSIDYNDDSKFNNQKNVLDLIDVLSSILEIKNNNTQNTLRPDNIEEKINKACVLYKSNKDVNVIVDIAKDIINSKTDDIFWIVASRDAFIYLILKQFNDKRDCNYKELVKIISDKNLFIKLCKETNKNENDVGDLENYADKVRKSSDKMLDSFYEIICSCLNIKPEVKKDNLELSKLIENSINKEDISLKDIILNIVEMIKDLQVETNITIAQLINYNPENSFVDPLTQGKVFNYVFDICKKININLENTHDAFGGLAYYYTFKKIKPEENNNDKLSEHIINSNINFKFKLPKAYGEITKKTDISFRIGNSINILIAKCSDISNLDERSLQWLENSAKTNNQNILKDKVRKYLLNNDTIQVVERMVEKNQEKRMYKFIYFNESMIIFAFSYNIYNEKFEADINNAIISIKEIGNQNKIERDPFEKVKDNKETNNNKFDLLLNIANEDFKKILKLATNNQTILFDNDKRLLSKNEMLSYKDDLNISVENIIPLIDLYDDNFLIYNINKNIFQLMDISSKKIYKDLDNIAEYIENIEKSVGKFIPKCPVCYEKLTFLMPDGQTLHCNKCGKYYKNENGDVGEETSSPYTRTDVLY